MMILSDPWRAMAIGQAKAEVETLGALLDKTDPTVLVPSCPPWTQDLNAHLLAVGSVWQGALGTASDGLFAPGEAMAAAATPVPIGGRADQLWKIFGPILDRLSSAERTETCWWFGFEDWTMADMSRRVLVELSIHRWDAQATTINQPVLDRLVAVAAVTEDTRFFVPRIGANTEPPGGWVELIDNTSAETVGWWAGQPPTKPAPVVVHSPPSDLCLARYGRIESSGLTVAGDRAVLDEWIDFFNP